MYFISPPTSSRSVWVGTSAGGIWVCAAEGRDSGEPGGCTPVAIRGETRIHLGGVRSLLLVGGEVREMNGCVIGAKVAAQLDVRFGLLNASTQTLAFSHHLRALQK